MKRGKGFRRSTRNKMKRPFKEKNTVNEFLEKFSEGDKVLIKINPSSHRALPHPRFKGRCGVVKGIRGKSYLVELKDGSIRKTIITKSEHLRHINK